MKSRFIISGFVDEAYEPLDGQIKVMKKLGMEYFEPRRVDGKGFTELSDEEIKAQRFAYAHKRLSEILERI